MDAEGDAVMTWFYLCPVADTISKKPPSSCGPLGANSQRPPSPDGIHDARDHDHAENNRGDAGHFEDGKLPKLSWIKPQAGIFGASKPPALI